MRIAFDESGNSGENLFDTASPHFVLASVGFAAEQIAELGEIFKDVKAPELKFSKLIGRPRNEQLLLNFFQSPHLNAETVKIDVVHKRFMVVAKYVDLILEPSARQMGLNLYSRAANIATSNLLHMVGPVFAKATVWESFLREFAQVVWKRDVSAWSKLLNAAETIYNQHEFTRPDFAGFFLPVLALRGRYRDFLTTLADNELDSIPSSYTILADRWGKQLQMEYDVIADEAKVLSAYIPILLKLADPSLNSFRAGYNSRTIDFPLKVKSIIPVASLSSKEVQLADLVAGATAYVLKNGREKSSNPFVAAISTHLFDKKLFTHALWPDKAISPSELGADVDENGCISLVDYATEVLGARPASNKNP